MFLLHQYGVKGACVGIFLSECVGGWHAQFEFCVYVNDGIIKGFCVHTASSCNTFAVPNAMEPDKDAPLPMKQRATILCTALSRHYAYEKYTCNVSS